MTKKQKRILALLLVLLLLFVFMVPVGVNGAIPEVNLTIHLTDTTTGANSEATLLLGEPYNPLTVFKPSTTFLPLGVTEDYVGTQEVTAVLTDTYAFYFEVAFMYGGAGIREWTQAKAEFSATTPHSSGNANFKVINEANKSTGDGVTVGYATSLPSPGTVISLNSPAYDKFRYVHTSAVVYVPLLGSDLDGCEMRVTVYVYGIDINGIPVVGTVTGLLTITVADTGGGGGGGTPVAGTITVTITSMGASINTEA